MQITKDIVVSEITFSRVVNVPIKIQFGFEFGNNQASHLSLDRKDCLALGLSPGQGLIEREVRIRLVSRKQREQVVFPSRPARRRRIRRKKPSRRVARQVGIFRISSLERTESVHIAGALNARHPTTVRDRPVLTLRTGGPYGSLSMVRSPDGFISIELTEEEYEKCKALPAGSYFKVKFSVGKKLEPVKPWGKPEIITKTELKRVKAALRKMVKPKKVKSSTAKKRAS